MARLKVGDFTLSSALGGYNVCRNGKTTALEVSDAGQMVSDRWSLHHVSQPFSPMSRHHTLRDALETAARKWTKADEVKFL